MTNSLSVSIYRKERIARSTKWVEATPKYLLYSKKEKEHTKKKRRTTVSGTIDRNSQRVVVRLFCFCIFFLFFFLSSLPPPLPLFLLPTTTERRGGSSSSTLSCEIARSLVRYMGLHRSSEKNRHSASNPGTLFVVSCVFFKIALQVFRRRPSLARSVWRSFRRLSQR